MNILQKIQENKLVAYIILTTLIALPIGWYNTTALIIQTANLLTISILLTIYENTTTSYYEYRT